MAKQPDSHSVDGALLGTLATLITAIALAFVDWTLYTKVSLLTIVLVTFTLLGVVLPRQGFWPKHHEDRNGLRTLLLILSLSCLVVLACFIPTEFKPSREKSTASQIDVESRVDEAKNALNAAQQANELLKLQLANSDVLIGKFRAATQGGNRDIAANLKTQLQQSLDALKQQMLARNQQYKQLSTSLHTLQETYSSLDEETKLLEAEIVSLQAEIKSLMQQLAGGA